MSLTDFLKQPTEIKGPAMQLAVGSESEAAALGFWGEDDTDDFGSNAAPQHSPHEREAARANGRGLGQETPDDSEQHNQSTTERWTPELGQASAITAVEMLDNSLRLVFTPLVNRKYAKVLKRKFTEEQIDVIAEIDALNVAPEALEDDAKRIFNKYEGIMKRRDSKIAAVALTPEEKDRSRSILEAYFEATKTSFDPKWLLAFTAVNNIGQRVADLITD